MYTLWNEPNDVRNWNAELDPYWFQFSEMIGNAAHWARHRGKECGDSGKQAQERLAGSLV